MSDPATFPPDAVGGEAEVTPWKRSRIPGVAMAGLFWVVAIVFWGQHFLDGPEPPPPEHLRYGDVSTQLQLLMQGKMLIAQGMALPQGSLTSPGHPGFTGNDLCGDREA